MVVPCLATTGIVAKTRPEKTRAERANLDKYIVDEPWDDDEICSENPRFDGEGG